MASKRRRKPVASEKPRPVIPGPTPSDRSDDGEWVEIPIPLSDFRDASGQLLRGPDSAGRSGYGRAELHRYGFFLGHGPIEPGTFVRQVGHWQWEPVPEDSIIYRGVALDRAGAPMVGLRHIQIFDPPRHLGYEVWEVDEFKARHADPKIARIIDLCDALSDEHARFRKFTTWKGSGYLAPSQEMCGVVYRAGPSGLRPPAPDVEYVTRCEVPMNARRIVSRTGVVYSSHLRLESPVGFPDAHGLGLAGPLSVAGHLVCLWPVLVDRLRELLQRTGIVREAVHLQRLAACDRQPIDWGDEERGWLEAARAEAQSLVDALRGNGDAHAIARGCDERSGLEAVRAEVQSLPSASLKVLSDEPEFRHAEDFTWVVWVGVKFDFSKGNQSESVRALWEAWEAGGRRPACGLSEKTIGEKCQSSNNNFRLAHVFRRHRAWGTIIRSIGRGKYALFVSESPKNHTL